MPSAETAQKIATHKFGRRKLTSAAALAHYNKLLNKDNVAALKGVLLADVALKNEIAQMNTALNAFFAQSGIVVAQLNGNQPVIGWENEDDLQVPKRVWLGEIVYPDGPGLTDQAYEQLEQTRKDFADAAGRFRARIAQILASLSVINDLGNITARPNPGGVVVGEKHTPANQGN